LIRRLLGAAWSRAEVCEIGAGTGRVAYWALRNGVRAYTIFDLPHVNVVQGYYLSKGLGPDRVALFGEPAPADGASMGRVLPAHAIRDETVRQYDLVLNQDSFPEIHVGTVREYLAWVRKVCRGHFLSVNHESKPRWAHGLQQLSVPEVIDEVGGFHRVDRFPYWLRRGYVAELYEVVR
jgi:putative sugar O-methyltransferase